MISQNAIRDYQLYLKIKRGFQNAGDSYCRDLCK